jgi:hypothetical protein
MDKSTYYADRSYISQSSLKSALGVVYDNPSNLGNIVDMFCTSPEEEDNFLISKSKVTPALKSIWLNIFNNFSGPTDEVILKAMGDYGKGSYDLDRVKKSLFKYEDYYHELNTGKEVVTEEEWSQGRTMANIVFKHPNTQFVKGALTQVAVFNENFYGHRCKGLLDWYLEEQRIVDLKTVFSIKAIYKNWEAFRYDIQGVFYHDLIGAKLPPRFIFVAPDADYPVVIEMLPESMLMAREGGLVRKEVWVINGKEIASQYYRYGYKDLLSRYEYITGIRHTFPANDYETIIHGIKKL